MNIRRRRKGPEEQGETNQSAANAADLADAARKAQQARAAAKASSRKQSVLCLVIPIAVAIAGIIFTAIFIPKSDEPSSLISSAKVAKKADESSSSFPSPQSGADDPKPSSSSSLSQAERQQREGEKDQQYTGMGTYRLLDSVPHDPKAFTQGLFLLNNTFLESTGMYGASQVRKVSAADGSVLQSLDMNAEHFGEGMAYYTVEDGSGNSQGRLIQITWKEKVGFVYDSDTLEVLQTFQYETVTGEGWGITHVPTAETNTDDTSRYQTNRGEFLVSDGSHFLMRWDAKTLQEKKDLRVPVRLLRRDMAQPADIQSINELEWDKFQPETVLANVWMQDVILRIDIETGFIRTVYDLQTLFTKRPAGTDVLNGIALTDEPNVIWVTGKYWPKMFRLQLLDP